MLEIRSELRNDKVVPVLYDDDEEVMVIPKKIVRGEELMDIPEKSMGTPEKKIQYVEHDDPKARMKPSPKPKPPQQFSSFKSLKHMDEEELDILTDTITDNVLNRLEEREEEEVPVNKGYLSYLLGAASLNELMRNRRKEEREHLEREFDRAYYKRKHR